MSVWFATPSKRPVAEAEACIAKWIERGYQAVVQRDPGDGVLANCLTVARPYQGYSEAVNFLCSLVLGDIEAIWIVTGGDDTDPDPNHTAERIAAECTGHFSGTLGVMQPTGDRWQEEDGRATWPDQPAAIDRICGSPWMGREFVARAYGGHGPMWPEYWHMFNDEELQNVAIKLGILWQRRDIIHMHNHWMKLGKQIPDFLVRANSMENWNKTHALFLARKAAGWPGHELLP